MPVASNRYYNDPSLGQAFANLADAFAPPSGSDASGYATAAATKEAASRLAWLFANPNDATASKRSSLTGVQEFGNTPEGYTYNVDTNATTLRRGQDVQAATDITNNQNTVQGNTITGLYGHPLAPGEVSQAVPENVMSQVGLPGVQSQAGLPKPLSADEVKAKNIQWLFENSNDPTAATRSSVVGIAPYKDTQPGFAQTNETTRRADELSAVAKLYGPLNQGQVRPAIPADIAAHVGLPEITQALGLDKPMSTDEVKAKTLSDLPVADQIDAVLSDIPVEKVGPESTFMRRSDAVGRNAAPTASPAATLNNYRTPDGKVGTYVVRNGKAVDSQTGAEVPPGSIDFSASLQGGGAETNLAPTAANITAGNNLNASLDSAEYTAKQMKAIMAQNPNASGIPARIKGLVQSLTSSAQQVISAYATEAPDAAIQLDEARALLEKTLGGGTGYDKDVVRLTSGLFDLAYARAQIANPTGEVSRQAFDRALESFGQTLFSSQTDVQVGLDAFLTDTIAAGRVKAKSLLQQNAGADPAATDAPPAAVEEWTRVDGKLVRVGGQ